MMIELQTPHISTNLQIETDSDIPCSFYKESITTLLRKALPEDLFFKEEFNEEKKAKCLAYLSDSFPILKWDVPKKAPDTLSIALVCKHRVNASHFFYDIIHRWLIPQKRTNIEMFFSADFRLPQLSTNTYTSAQILVNIKTEQELEELKRNLRNIETEIRLGVVSGYHANRILEFKGLSNDGKTAMIQEKIGSLIKNRSDDYDRGIFLQMQRFLVTCREEFKRVRDHHHISRIISVFYSIRKTLGQKIEMLPNRRHFIVKFIKTRLTDSGNERPVLGVLVGLNFLRQHEVFEKAHLIKALKNFIPDIQAVESSFFMDRNRENTIQNIYLEIEKEDGRDFSLEEIKRLRQSLPEQLKGHIEYLMHPVFMPRNEEEVVRNIMSLSKQLRYVHDIPQVIISFDEQKDHELIFTIVLLRVLRPGAQSVQKVFENRGSRLKYIPDRVRKIGTLRRRYVKEATVFRTKLDSKSYFRADHSVDLYKARQDIISELNNVLGEVRDFNGGMFCKQNELYLSLKESINGLTESQQILMDKFFHSITPIEMRSVQPVEPLKQLFQMLHQMVEKNHFYQKKYKNWSMKKEGKNSYVIFSIQDAMMKKNILEAISKLQLFSYQLLSFSVDFHEVNYFGYLFTSEESAEHEGFIETVQQSLDLRA